MRFKILISILVASAIAASAEPVKRTVTITQITHIVNGYRVMVGLAQTKTAPVSPQTATNSTQASYDRNLFWDLATGKKTDKATLEALTAIAQAGNAQAQFDLADLYIGLGGFPKDLTKAEYWFRRAADQGIPEAEIALGAIYAESAGVPQNPAPDPSTTARTKVDELLPAAFKGDKAALEQLKTLGTGGDKDTQLFLGSIYRDGSGAPADAALAVFWYRKAAEQGQVDAQYFLGVMYDQGEGVPQNFVEATRWYEMAATNGHLWSQYNLGQMYFLGQGIPRNYLQAIKWTQLAADRGYADAMHNLSIAYENGFGVPQNYTIAHMWENLAAARNPQYAKDRDALARKMTAAQVAEAQKLASEWKPKK